MITYAGRLSPTARAIPPSAIRRFFDLANTMTDVISLGVGEPDFVTPWHIREAGLHALERGMTSYTTNAGLLSLRQAIARDLRRYGALYRPEGEILVTVGGSEAIDLAIRVLVSPGDEVLVAEPTYVSYRPLVQLAGGVPVGVPLEMTSGFRLEADAVRQRITPRTKALVLCNPNNPTGSVLHRPELERLAEVVIEHDLLVISDEIYAELTYGATHVSMAAIAGMAERTILIGGFSKAFAMTGWRLGYAAGPEEVVRAMLTVHQYTMLCAPVMAQMAGLEAMEHGAAAVAHMVAEYDARRRLIVKGFNDMGLTCVEPEGAFYAFPDIRSTGMTSAAFAEELLRQARVAVVPGSAFGLSGEGFIRCSYATAIQAIEEALERIRKFLAAGG